MKFIYLLTALMLSIGVSAQEICQNGIDDDGDGLTDMNDPDCLCYNASTLPSSLITNYSFEEKLSCPTTMAQMDLVKGWVSTTSGTPDYFNCNYSWSSVDNAGITATQGTGYVGALYAAGWKEYIGTCLAAPLEYGTPYQLVMDMAMFSIDGDGNSCGNSSSNYTPIEVTIYGNKHCSTLSQVGNYGCPTGDDTEASPYSDSSWVILGTATYTPNSEWTKVTFNFTPTFGVNAIMIGAPCSLPASFYADLNCNPYAVYDNLVLNTYASYFTTSPAPVVTATKTVDCEGDHYTLVAQEVPGVTQYWMDADKNIHEGSTLKVDQPGDLGIFTAYYVSGNCSSSVATLKPSVDFTWVETTSSEIVLPNIITPNGDGANDELNAETIVEACSPYELTIFDRWGGLVYKQSNGEPAFTGKNILGNTVSDGVYFYSIKYRGTFLKASLTVVR